MFGSKMGAVEKAIKKSNAGALMELAGNKEREVGLAAIVGLGAVGGHEATNFLISQLGNPDAEFRIAVAQALGVIGDKHTKAFVSAQISKETDDKVREAMGAAMANIKSY